MKHNPLNVDYSARKEDLEKIYRELVNLEKTTKGDIAKSLVRRRRQELGAYLEKE